MKKNLGSQFTLYPSLVGVIGSIVDEKANFALVCHYGIVSHSHILVSMNKAHYSNKGIREKKSLSINLIDKNLLDKATYVGTRSGNNIDKSKVFDYTLGETGVPLISAAPVSIECQVDDIYEIDGFDNFICTIKGVYVDERYLTEDGKHIDYRKFKPVLFDFSSYQYLETGEVLGKCLTYGRNL